MTKIVQWLWGLPFGKVICVVSWRPSIGKHGIEWPTMIVQNVSSRSVISPVWNEAWFRARFATGNGQSAGAEK